MKRNLEELLRMTDAGMGVSTRIPNLGNRVRGLRSRKRWIRGGIAACGFAIGITSILIIALTTKPSARIIATTNPVVNRHQETTTTKLTTKTHPQVNPLWVNTQHSTSLDAIAQVHERTADLLLRSDRRSPKRTARRTVDINNAQQQRDRAALILIYDADRYLRDQRPADAIAAYRRTVDLFPQSQWADVARERLKQHES